MPSSKLTAPKSDSESDGRETVLSERSIGKGPTVVSRSRRGRQAVMLGAIGAAAIVLGVATAPVSIHFLEQQARDEVRERTAAINANADRMGVGASDLDLAAIKQSAIADRDYRAEQARLAAEAAAAAAAAEAAALAAAQAAADAAAAEEQEEAHAPVEAPEWPPKPYDWPPGFPVRPFIPTLPDPTPPPGPMSASPGNYFAE